MMAGTGQGDWGQYFAGWVPASLVFGMQLDDVRKINAASFDESLAKSVAELCYVGVVSKFEAFWKYHFGEVINIMPELGRRLEGIGDVRVDAVNLIDRLADIEITVGFLIAEEIAQGGKKIGFGAPRAINELFCILTGQKPFTARELEFYEEIRHTRNLLVHHGGTPTPRYLAALRKRGVDLLRLEAFHGTKSVTSDEVLELIDFVENVSERAV